MSWKEHLPSWSHVEIVTCDFENEETGEITRLEREIIVVDCDVMYPKILALMEEISQETKVVTPQGESEPERVSKWDIPELKNLVDGPSASAVKIARFIAGRYLKVLMYELTHGIPKDIISAGGMTFKSQVKFHYTPEAKQKYAHKRLAIDERLEPVFGVKQRFYKALGLDVNLSAKTKRERIPV